MQMCVCGHAKVHAAYSLKDITTVFKSVELLKECDVNNGGSSGPVEV